MKTRILIFSLFVLPLLVVFCEKTEGEGSGGLDPGGTNPEIIEGFICSDVFDNKPRGIDNNFLPDDVVYLWLSWENVAGEHEVRVIWVDPDDNIIHEAKQQFDSKSGKQVTFFFIDTTSSAPAGRWIVEVHIDGRFVRSYAFWIIEG